jgi:digeranylgeranylglycerophospholipid reductase
MSEYDVIVIGAGPAGSTAARIIAEAGFKVLIIEKGHIGRNKACGGAIRIQTFEKLNLKLEDFVEREISGIRMYSPSGSVIEHDHGKTTGITVYRDKFDFHLLNLAINSGAEVLTDTLAKDVSIMGDSAEIIVEKNNILQKKSCKLIVAADGVFSNISKKVGLSNYDRNLMGVCSQFEMEMKESDIEELIGDKIELYFGDTIAPGGYGWIFPKKNGVTVGVGMPLPRRKNKMSDYLNAFIEKHPEVSYKLKGAKVIGKNGGVVPLKGVIGKTYSDNLLVVGDAAGHVSPLTAEGIYYSMISAKCAASLGIEALSENNLSENKLKEYEKKWKKEIGADLKWGILLYNILLSENRKVDYLVNEAKKDECLRALTANFISGCAPYNELLKKYYKAILPFFLKGLIKKIYI